LGEGREDCRGGELVGVGMRTGAEKVERVRRR